MRTVPQNQTAAQGANGTAPFEGNGHASDPVNGKSPDKNGDVLRDAILQHRADPTTGMDDDDEELMQVVRQACEDVKRMVAEPIDVKPSDIKLQEGRTESNAALLLVEKFGDLLRYVLEWKHWIVWDGTRWGRDASGVLVQDKAIKTASQLFQMIADLKEPYKTNDWLVKQLAAFATHTSSSRGIAAMVALARSKVPISVRRLDTDPWLLNVANGTLDLRSGKWRRPYQSDYITKLCPTPYEPNAKCPTWLRFLQGVFAGNTGLIKYLQRLLGYSLTGHVHEQNLPILWGEGSNGKTTLVTTIMHILGADYAGAPPRQLFKLSSMDRHPTELMTLQGKRLMVGHETQEEVRLDEALIKCLTGGDRITARGMNENFSSFDPTHKLWLSTNYKPQIRGTNYAIWRRVKLIPFTQTFWDPDAAPGGSEGRPEHLRADKSLVEKMKAEAAGILVWMVRGCMDWQQHGLEEPEVVRVKTREYAAEQDVIGEFIGDYCDVGPDYEEEAGNLWHAFQTAMPDSGISQTAFGTQLGRRGYEKGRIKHGPRRNNISRRGLRLRPIGFAGEKML
jgi:putative DNA primase/helicase